MKIKQTLYKIIENKLTVIIVLSSLTIIFGTIGFNLENKSFYDTVMGIVDLFVFESIEKYNFWLFLGRVFALMTVFFGVLSFFVYRFFNHLVIESTIRKPYTLVVGLGENNRHYLNSEVNNTHNIVVVEKYADNPKIETYIKKGFGVKIADILNKDIYKKLQLNNIENVIISTGSDKRNLEILTKMLNTFDETKHKRLYVHLEDFLLKSLFTEEIIKHKNSEIITFSFYELAVQNLLLEHSILGDKKEIIKGTEDFYIAIIGIGDLALQMVYQLCNLAHLPNENKLIIYCVDKDAKLFIEKVKRSFMYVDNIATIELEAICHDVKELDFYQQKIWHQKNLTNILITKREDEENLNIALDFYNKCYIKDISENKLKTKIIFASYKHKELSQSFNDNQDRFKQFYTFANARDIFKKESLLNEELDRIAKLIHNGYGDIYNENLLLPVDDNKVNEKWFQKSSLHDKISNRMQTMHIDIKLLALGLKKVKSTKPAKELLVINKKIFKEKLGHVDISNGMLLEYSKELEKAYGGKDYNLLYFPKEFNSLFEKLIRSEHNRWNAYHYLHGWSYSETKNKAFKEHNCLLALNEFKTKSIRLTVIYDIYAVLYIPNLLASVGYEIK